MFHNDESGYTVLHVEIPSEFELARNPEITVVGKAQAVWEGEDVKAEGQWVTDKVHGLDQESYHLVLLCENQKGYQNLCYMVSEAFLHGFYGKPRIDLELLEQRHEGLIALSACLAGSRD